MKTAFWIALVAALCTSRVEAQTAPRAPGADLIIVDAVIFTNNPGRTEASALAVKDGRIYSVGADTEILALKGPNTRVIDAGGRRLIPGIIDGHPRPAP